MSAPVPITAEQLEEVRNALLLGFRIHHPDRGGSDAAMSELNWAWAQAQETLK